MRYWEDFQVGEETLHGTKEITADEIVRFAREFDPQPIYTEESAAANGPFGGLVASGWLATAVATELFVRSVLLNAASKGSTGFEDLRWVQPVRPGDVVRGKSRVADSWPSESGDGILMIDHELLNQRGELVLSFREQIVIARKPLDHDG